MRLLKNRLQGACHGAERGSQPPEPENAQGRCHCGHDLFFVDHYGILASSYFGSSRSSGARMWLGANSSTVALALNLMPFAGIAFLWFIGVLRDRLGQLEDQFFATVFFGSGVLFLGMLFTASAVVGAIVLAFVSQPADFINSATFHFARDVAYSVVNIYMIKMAGVFMTSTSMVVIYPGFVPRWLAVLGYVLALLLLLGSYHIRWSFIVFPVWVFTISICILLDNMSIGRRRSMAAGAE
jgi:hypothetical protein